MRRGTKLFLALLVIPLALVLVAAVALAIAGLKDVGWTVSYLGTVEVLAFDFGYIMLFDSKKRWPQLSARQRFTKVFSFTR